MRLREDRDGAGAFGISGNDEAGYIGIYCPDRKVFMEEIGKQS